MMMRREWRGGVSCSGDVCINIMVRIRKCLVGWPSLEEFKSEWKTIFGG